MTALRNLYKKNSRWLLWAKTSCLTRRRPLILSRIHCLLDCRRCLVAGTYVQKLTLGRLYHGYIHFKDTIGVSKRCCARLPRQKQPIHIPNHCCSHAYFCLGGGGSVYALKGGGLETGERDSPRARGRYGGPPHTYK